MYMMRITLFRNRYKYLWFIRGNAQNVNSHGEGHYALFLSVPSAGIRPILGAEGRSQLINGPIKDLNIDGGVGYGVVVAGKWIYYKNDTPTHWYLFLFNH